MNNQPLTRRERRDARKQTRNDEQQKRNNANDKRQRNKKIINFTFIALLLVGFAYGGYTLLKPDTTPGQFDTFAKCITQKGATMYGTDWCPHCQAQKKLFGKSFTYVNFINCDTNKVACDAAGVKGYPTWVFRNGERVSGEQELAKLAELSSCQI